MRGYFYRPFYMTQHQTLYEENLRLRWLLLSGLTLVLGVVSLWLPFNPWDTGRA